MMDSMSKVGPMAGLPGFDAMRAQQEAFFRAMGGTFGARGETPPPPPPRPEADDLGEIKRQLAELQDRLARMGR
jgi:polyhydroxyalkanoate synthesis regulator protein